MSDTDNRGGISVAERPSDQRSSLSVSRQCKLLASDRRRVILRYLAARPDEPIGVEALGEYLTASGTTDDRREIVVSLRHTHLPKLADADVVHYDREREQLWYLGDDDLEELLECIGEECC